MSFLKRANKRTELKQDRLWAGSYPGDVNLIKLMVFVD
jgi:hypothetical protein